MNAPVRTKDEIKRVIFDVLGAIAPEADPATIVPNQPLREQIDIDSFDFLNVIIRLHEVLGVEIPESDYAELATLDGAVEYLVRRSAGGEAQPAGKTSK
jgi:acyl carrier protein